MTYARFCQEYKCNLEDIKEFVRLAKRHKRFEEYSISGDHFGLITDKHLASKEWDKSAKQVLDKMKKLALQMGFTGIDFSGLYPTLTRGSERWINLPE